MADKIKQKTCYIYTRVSTAMQVDAYSLEAQEDRLRKEAEHRGFEVTGVYPEKGKSGKNIAGREVFRRMLYDIGDKSKETPDYVYVFKLSRFGRNAADALSALQYLEDYGVSLLCVEDGIDSAGVAGKLLIAVYAAVAETERENILVQTMAGRYQKARDGLWNGGMAPYGYRIEKGKLIIEESEAEIVRLIFDKYTNGKMGINAVAKWLNVNGYKKTVRKNSKLDRFSDKFVRNVLDNPVYSGFIAYGRRKNEKIEGKRNEYHVVKQKDYEIYEGVHEAIIDRDLWYKAKAKRELNGYVRPKRFSLEHAHVLSGILKCPKCGAPMYGVVNRKKKKGKDEYYTDMWYYLCKNRKMSTGRTCDYNKHIRQDVLDGEVIGIIQNVLKDSTFTSDVLGKIQSNDNLETKEADLKRIESARNKEEKKKTALLSRINLLDPSDDLYSKLFEDLLDVLRQIESNIEQFDEQIIKLEQSIETVKGKQITSEMYFEVMLSLIEDLEMVSDDYKRIVMNYLLDSIQIHEKPTENGHWVKKLRFKVALNVDGRICDQIEVSDYQDSLPLGKHDETVCLLSNRKPDTKVRIDVDLEDYYRIKDAKKNQN